MKNRDRSRSSRRTTETPRWKEESSDIDVEEVNNRSRRVVRNEKGSYEIESSEESSKSENRRFSRIRERSLRRTKSKTRETMEEAIDVEETFSHTLNKSPRSFESTSRERRERSTRIKGKDRNTEIPIVDMLRKALDKEHADYYGDAVTTSALTTDKIYVQGKNGFSAVSVANVSKEDGGCSKDVEVLRRRSTAAETAKGISAPITIAIIAQKCWKRTSLVYQGLLGGMALLHLAMIQVFFDTSMEFISKYSLFSEIYTSLFSLLIALSVISTFDKFDIAHLEMDRLYDIRGDYIGSAIAIPLYVLTLCLHETFANVDDRLALIHYRDFNYSMWNSNTTCLEDLLDGLTTWEKINVSKDILAALGWLLVAVGTPDDTLLMHLESMQEYRSDTRIPCVE